MSGPSVKIYFSSQEEYHTILKVAAQHDLTLPQYVLASVIRTTNEVFSEREKAEKLLNLERKGEENNKKIGETNEVEA